MIDECTGLHIEACPFCKSEIARVVIDHDSNGYHFFVVECGGCTALGPESDIQEDVTTEINSAPTLRKQAINRWNNRT